MSLLQLVRVNVGEVGIVPGTVKMLSTESLATITTAGYLNGVNNGNIVSGVQLAPTDVIECLYSYNSSTGSCSYSQLRPTFSNGVITLTADAGNEALTNGHIFVGNSSNVAADVAMSGDITITNAGVTAIGAGKIVNAQINAAAAIAFSKLATLASGNLLVGSAGGVATSVALSGDATMIASGAITIANSAVTLAKLASGVSPAYVSKFGGQQANGGGSATIAITVTGLTTSHVCLANVQASTNAVSVLKVTPTSNTLTVLLSGDPGAATVIAYQCFLAAS